MPPVEQLDAAGARKALRVPNVVHDVEPYKAETAATLGSMAAGAIGSVGSGTGMLGGAFKAPGAMLLGVNLKGRKRQMGVTNQILNNPREWDAQVGVPTKLASPGRRFLAAVGDMARFPLDAESRAVAKQVRAGGGKPWQNLAETRADRVGEWNKTYAGLDPYQVEDMAEQNLRNQMTHPTMELPAVKVSSIEDILDRLPDSMRPGKKAVTEPETLEDILKLVMPKVRGSLAPLLAKAAVLPAGVASVFALDQAYKGGKKLHNRMSEGSRFQAAVGDLRPGDFGSPDFEDRLEEDPAGMMRGLREQFKVLNEQAPMVAKNPVVAREFMRRMMLDPNYRVPPEQYLRTFGEAVALENAMQSAQPSLFDGIGGTVGTVLKG